MPNLIVLWSSAGSAARTVDMFAMHLIRFSVGHPASAVEIGLSTLTSSSCSSFNFRRSRRMRR
jgi:hypothetical protein